MLIGYEVMRRRVGGSLLRGAKTRPSGRTRSTPAER
jgi:hypothetical protein